MRRIISLRRFWAAAGALFAVLVVAAGAGLWYASSQSSAATSYTVTAGGGEAPVAVEVFGAANVTVNAGDTVIWTNGYLEPHTITFPGGPPPANLDAAEPVSSNPSNFVVINGGVFVSSGFIEQGQQFAAEFLTPGKYHYLCLIHPGMEADVTVQPTGSPGASTQVDLSQQSTARVQPALAAGRAALAALPKATSTKNASGTTTWSMGMGASVPVTGGTADVQVFNQPNLTIKTGDTVTWTGISVPHTITFNGGGNPFVPTAPRATFDGTGYLNSGAIGTSPQSGAVASTFSLTFTKAGTYPYICLLHIPQGMAGVIVVSDTGAPSGGGLGAPNTGDAGLFRPNGDRDGSSSVALALMLVVIAAAGFGGAWKVARRPR